MVDLTITAANVVATGSANKETGTAGATITAGQTVYKEAATGQFKLADSNSATVEARTPYGVALHASLAGQPLTVILSGDYNPGSAVVAGTAYMQSETPGGIQPYADLTAGELVTQLGFATTTANINVSIKSSGVVI